MRDQGSREVPRGGVLYRDELPRRRQDEPPVDDRDLEERIVRLVLKSDEALGRYNCLGWHRVWQRLVLITGLAALACGLFTLVLLAGLPLQVAAQVTVLGLASSGGGLGVFTAANARFSVGDNGKI